MICSACFNIGKNQEKEIFNLPDKPIETAIHQ